MKDRHYFCGICGSTHSNASDEGISCNARWHEISPMVYVGKGKKGEKRAKELAEQYERRMEGLAAIREGKFKAGTGMTVIVGEWAEDGSTYDITVPHQLRTVFLKLLATVQK